MGSWVVGWVSGWIFLIAQPQRKASCFQRFPISRHPMRLCPTFSLNVFQYFFFHPPPQRSAPFSQSTANFSTWPNHFWPSPRLASVFLPWLSEIWFCFFFAPTFSWFSCPATRTRVELALFNWLLTLSANSILIGRANQWRETREIYMIFLRILLFII